MSPTRRPGRRAPRPRRAKRGANPTRPAPEQSGPLSDPIELAVSTLAAELPALVTTAIQRAKSGKPATLLRSVHRMIRELGERIELNKRNRPQEWDRLAAAGPLSAEEAHFLGNALQMFRRISAERDATLAHRNTATAWTPAQLEQCSAAAAAPRKDLDADPTSPAAAPPYTGPERRTTDIPSHVFLGKQERRHTRP